jgi:hypothetical protein
MSTIIPFRPRARCNVDSDTTREVEFSVRLHLTPDQIAEARALRTNTERLLFIGTLLLRQTDTEARRQLDELLVPAESPLELVAAQLALIEGVDTVLASFGLASSEAAAMAADGAEPHFDELPAADTAL